MFALALTLSLASGGLLADQTPATFSVRLVSSATLADVETMSRTELEMERASLIDHRASLAPGIVLLAVGGGATLFFGLPILLLGLVGEFLDLILVGAVISIVGAGAIVAGIVLLVMAGAARSASAARIGQIDDRIRRMEQNSTPPPPPPPPSGWVVPAEPSLLVANF